ncbi:endonuclease [Salmonella enterica]|nr:endonuclease [Salmonella enterica]
MQEVKIYTASPSDLSPPVQSESFCVDMVLASDYAELEAKYAALAADNDKAMESLKQADAVVKLAHEKFSALASENAALKKSEVEFNEYCRRECEDVGDTWVDDFTETPATDTFLAEVTQEAVESLKKEIEWLKKQLLMSVGDIRDLIDYNPENGVLTAKVNFSGRQAGSVIGSQTWQGYYAFSLFGKKCFAHRLAWLLHYGEWPSQPIDHINGIKTDNSIRNLRLCSLSQNQFNKPTQKNNTTGVKGVYWNKRDKRYVASVQFNGKKYSAGHHKDIDSAKEAVMKLREKLAGEFTNHGEFELAAQLRKGASL